MKKRILVVDDEKNIRLTLAKSLTSDTVRVDQAISAEEAMESLGLVEYDLMLLDLRLPGMDGVELLEQIRESGIAVKTIIISAHGTIDIAVKLLFLASSQRGILCLETRFWRTGAAHVIIFFTKNSRPLNMLS